MRLSLLLVAIAIIFVLAIVHSPVEANAVADPRAEADPFLGSWGKNIKKAKEILLKVNDIIEKGTNAVCQNKELVLEVCDMIKHIKA